MEWTELHILRRTTKEVAARRTAFRRPDFTRPPHVFSGCGAFAARIAVLCLLLCSCSLDDYRDECCERGPAMRYSYCPYGQEAFAEYISTLRHYLFDEAGNYLGELPPGADLQYQPLSLDAGSYTMVTVGNASDHTLCECAPQQGLEASESLTEAALRRPGGYSLQRRPGLYWGVKSFTVDGEGGVLGLPTKGTRGAPEEMTTYMNNIHCHLEIKVVWDNMPEYIGDYEMELENVHAGYSLCPERSQQAGGFTVPACGEKRPPTGYACRCARRSSTGVRHAALHRRADTDLPAVVRLGADNARYRLGTRLSDMGLVSLEHARAAVPHTGQDLRRRAGGGDTVA